MEENEVKLEIFEKETIFVQDLNGNTGLVNVKDENELLEIDVADDPLALDDVQNFYEGSLSSLSVDSAAEENNEETKRRKKERVGKRCISKKACNTGQSYVNWKGVLVRAREMGTGCDVNCRNRCHQKISTIDRRRVFDHYWKLGDHTRQWDFIIKHVTINKRKFDVENSKKKCSLNYFLPAEVVPRIKVCKPMFLKTLDISNSCVFTALNKLRKDSKITADGRGKHSKTNIQKTEALNASIRNHINVLTIEEVPYTSRGNASVRHLHQLYQAWMLEKNLNGQLIASERRYREIFNKEFKFKFKKKIIGTD